MVYGVSARLAFQTANRRNNVRDALLARIEGKPQWAVTEIVDTDYSWRIPGGQHGLRVEVYFTSQADADDLSARADALFGSNPPLPGSTLKLTQSKDDDPNDQTPDSILLDKTY
jgi:hypothetical protein